MPFCRPLVELHGLLRRGRTGRLYVDGHRLQEAMHLLYGVYVLASRFITAIDKIYEPRFLAQENPGSGITGNGTGHCWPKSCIDDHGMTSSEHPRAV